MGKKYRTRKQKGGAHDPLPSEVTDWILTNNTAALEQAFQSNMLDPMKEYTYSKDVSGLGKKRGYDGTLLGFLFGLQMYLYGVPIPKRILESLYFFFLRSFSLDSKLSSLLVCPATEVFSSARRNK